jgi:hypothetical protein
MWQGEIMAISKQDTSWKKLFRVGSQILTVLKDGVKQASETGPFENHQSAGEGLSDNFAFSDCCGHDFGVGRLNDRTADKPFSRDLPGISLDISLCLNINALARWNTGSFVGPVVNAPENGNKSFMPEKNRPVLKLTIGDTEGRT